MLGLFARAMLLWMALIAPAVVLGQDPPVPELRTALRDDATLRDVFFVDANQGWAVGDRGVIWYTPDGGSHWLNQESGVGCTLRSVHFVNARQGWIAGGWIEPHSQISRGLLLRTEDGGRTWQHIESDLPSLRKIQFLEDGRLLASGDWSPVFLSSSFLSHDGGLAWQPIVQTEPGHVSSAHTNG